jgi:hypothetical protein
MPFSTGPHSNQIQEQILSGVPSCHPDNNLALPPALASLLRTELAVVASRYAERQQDG